jgi:hypothetical protein
MPRQERQPGGGRGAPGALRADRLARPTLALLAGALAVVLGAPVASAATPTVAWTRQLGSAANDVAHGAAVDGKRNAIVVGETGGALFGTHRGSGDAFVRKLGPQGQTRWSRQFGTVEDEWATGVAVDRSGNAFVVGHSQGKLGKAHLGGADAFVRKVSPAGKTLWTRQFGTGANDYVNGVAVDRSGNVYGVGYTAGKLGAKQFGSEDAFVRKFGPTGKALWTRQFGTTQSDVAHGVAVDASGDVVVVGRTDGALGKAQAGGGDAIVRRYSPSGRLRWTRQFGTAERDEALGVAIDGSGNAYVVGYVGAALVGAGFGTDDAFIRKLGLGGKVRWTRQFGTASGDYANAVVTDRKGRPWVAGDTGGVLGDASLGASDAYLRAYRANGSERWTMQFGTPSVDSAATVALDARGSAILAGSTYGSLAAANAGNQDAFVRKIVME